MMDRVLSAVSGERQQYLKQSAGWQIGPCITPGYLLTGPFMWKKNLEKSTTQAKKFPRRVRLSDSAMEVVISIGVPISKSGDLKT